MLSDKPQYRKSNYACTSGGHIRADEQNHCHLLTVHMADSHLLAISRHLSDVQMHDELPIILTSPPQSHHTHVRECTLPLHVLACTMYGALWIVKALLQNVAESLENIDFVHHKFNFKFCSSHVGMRALRYIVLSDSPPLPLKNKEICPSLTKNISSSSSNTLLTKWQNAF